MNRRFFLQKGVVFPNGSKPRGEQVPATSTRLRDDKGADASSLQSAGDLSPYQPRPDKPWDERRIAHLLRRVGYGPTVQDIATAASSTPSAIVDAMLAPSALPAAPGSWATDQPFAQVNDTERAKYYTWVRDTQEWWINLMLTPGAMLREKMTLFWHNHFVSEYPKVEITQLLLKQNQLYRENAFGDFRDLTKKVTIDPAMLIYLDGVTSKQGNPNENYARELLELFTLGAGNYQDGTPHYTEHDIIELAKSLTGWKINGLVSEFKSAAFDSGNKAIFGTTSNFGLVPQTVNVIDHIFSQNDKDLGQKRAAVFLCSKLYQHFVTEVPDMAIVAEMAKTLENSSWQVGPVLRQLLTSEHFFDDNVIGSKIKSPVEFVLSSIRQLGLTVNMNRNMSDPGKPEIHDPVYATWYLTQWLFYPPNVKGWIGGRNWISSATIPLRIRYSKMWIEPVQGALPYNFNPVAWVKTFPDADKVEMLLEHILALMVPVPVSAETKKLLLEELLAGGATYEWDPDAANASTRIRACLIRIANLGEYQLM